MRCFNCGDADHRISECKVKRDRNCINMNKSWMHDYARIGVKKTRESFHHQRYFVHSEPTNGKKTGKEKSKRASQAPAPPSLQVIETERAPLLESEKQNQSDREQRGRGMPPMEQPNHRQPMPPQHHNNHQMITPRNHGPPHLRYNHSPRHGHSPRMPHPNHHHKNRQPFPAQHHYRDDRRDVRYNSHQTPRGPHSPHRQNHMGHRPARGPVGGRPYDDRSHYNNRRNNPRRQQGGYDREREPRRRRR